MKNLGYANSWGNNRPEIVKECEKKKHNPAHHKTAMRNVEIVGCEACRYKYYIDSSG